MKRGVMPFFFAAWRRAGAWGPLWVKCEMLLYMSWAHGVENRQPRKSNPAEKLRSRFLACMTHSRGRKGGQRCTAPQVSRHKTWKVSVPT